MRTLTILASGLITVLCQTHVYAQTNVYHAFPESNAEWVVTTQVSGSCWGVCANKYVLTGIDTLIGQFNYFKVNRVNISAVGPDPCCNEEGCCMYFRNDTLAKSVSYINEFGEDAILYDFNLQVDDTVPGHVGMTGGLWPIVVSSIDSIQVLSSYHKRWNMLIMGEPRSIIEGIGNTNGLFEPISLASETTLTLTCVSIDNDIVYGTEDCGIVNIENELIEPSIYPNPVNDILSIELKYRANFQIEIFNLFGHLELKAELNSITTLIEMKTFSSGLYIVKFRADNGEVFHFRIVKQ